jgi:hypothetical protein
MIEIMRNFENVKSSHDEDRNVGTAWWCGERNGTTTTTT